MAFIISARLFIKQLVKSEIIMNKVLQTSLPMVNVADKYIQELKSIDIKSQDSDPAEFLVFPLKTFYKFSKISMENIINESFDIMKDKGITSIEMYENLINSYFKFGININANDIFQTMVANKVEINQKIYSYFIRILSLNAQMDDVEQILEEMKSKGLKPIDTDKFTMVTGYIIAGHPEKSEIVIKNNNLHPYKSKLCFAKCYAYAAINDLTKLGNILTEIEENAITFYASDYFRLYRRLIESNVSQSALEEIIDLTKKKVPLSSADLFGTVMRLNSNDYYNQSIFLIYKFLHLVDDNVVFLEMFTYSNCPINTFKKALTLLMRCESGSVRMNTNIFVRVDIDTALEISQQFAKIKNWKIVYFSLINRAADEKSFDVFQSVLEFSLKNIPWHNFNDLLFSLFFNAVQRTGMIRDYEEILDLLPRFRKVMFRVILMKYLCRGDYDRYNELRLKDESEKEIVLAFSWKNLAQDIRSNLNLEQIKKWSEEARKCFSSEIVHRVQLNLFYDEIIRLSKSESLIELDRTIEFLREWNLRLTRENVKFLLQFIPQHHQNSIKSSLVKAIDNIDYSDRQNK